MAELEARLADLEGRGLRRPSERPAPAGLLSFASNDYLGLADRPAPSVRSGSGSSRLVDGDADEHRRLEHRIARWLELESALLFSSGYAANVGAIPALAAAGDLLVSDALNHASIVDGARLSRARIVVVPHNDVAAIERALRERTERRAWVLVESYYSMDADGPDLPSLRRLCDEHAAGLFVDEAHALGVLGPDGRGRLAEGGSVADVLVGTLGKALGSQGAFVAGRRVVREWLWNRARSFVFSTGLAPSSAAAAEAAIEHVCARPDVRAEVSARAADLRDQLSGAGLDVRGFGHIVPVVLGDSSRAVAVAGRLRDRGLFVPAIRPPTVPADTARLRITVTARHTPDDVLRLADALRAAYEG